MILQLKLKGSFLANFSYDSTFLELLEKVVLWEGKDRVVSPQSVFLTRCGPLCWCLVTSEG